MIQITESEIVQRLEFDNPWWKPGVGLDAKTASYPRRSYFRPFFDLLTSHAIQRALILLGPRRVGKTVMVFHAISELLKGGKDGRHIMYLSLETPLYTGLPLERLLGFFLKKFEFRKEAELYIFFDEVQYFPNWEVHLKSLVDSYPKFRFVATGSSAAALRLKSRESGAGRFTEFSLPPLTFAEFLAFVKKEDLVEIKETDSNAPPQYRITDISLLNTEFINYLNYGGYPEAVFIDQIRQDSGRFIKSDIIDKVLLRDLPSLYGIEDIQELNRLFTTLAYNTGNEVSLEDLSKNSGVAKNTLKRYLEYLEAAFLVKRITRLDQTAKRLKRATTFKVYLANPSMRGALFGYARETDEQVLGHLAETAIYCQWFHSESVTNLFYARWANGEIDIVNLGREGRPNWAVEVKWSDRLAADPRPLDPLIAFIKTHKLDSLLVTTRTAEKRITYQGLRVDFVPSALQAFIVGRNVVKYKFSQEPRSVKPL